MMDSARRSALIADKDISVSNLLASGSIAFALFALAVCWWFPFGPLIAVVAGTLAFLALVLGGTTPQAVLGLLLAGAAAGTGLVLGWNDAWRLVGLQ
jgi:hypothetical protein